MGDQMTKEELQIPAAEILKSVCQLSQSEDMAFCGLDSAFLCLSCHCRRRWTCTADTCQQAASNDNIEIRTLCVTCDDDDDVQPLMRRHKRILVKSTSTITTPDNANFSACSCVPPAKRRR